MKRFVMTGTVLIAAGTVLAATSQPPATGTGAAASNAPSLTASVKSAGSNEAAATLSEGAVTGNAEERKSLTGAQILKGLKSAPKKERAKTVAEMKKGKSQLAMVKVMAALAHMDDAQKAQLALAEQVMDDMIELCTLIDQAEAAEAAGDSKKAEEVNKAAEVKANEFAKIQERMAKTMPEDEDKVGDKEAASATSPGQKPQAKDSSPLVK